MRRRTKRTRLRPRPFIVLGLAVNLLAGAAYSPVTAVRRVRVEGAPQADAERLTRLLQSLRNVPCARVNPRILESRALENPELRSASLSRNLFGSAVLRVARRVPVARMDPQLGAGLTEDGVVYPSSVSLEGLPTVRLPESVPGVVLALGNAWRATDVARLAVLVRDVPSPKPVGIDVQSGGRVCLNIGTGRVDLGDFDKLDEKVDRLVAILRERPDLFDTVAKLSLVVLENPVYVPRPGALKP